MDLFSVLPLIFIICLGFYAIVIKLANRKKQQDMPPTGAAPYQCGCMNCYDCLTVPKAGAPAGAPA
jgi:hypothetical protein